MLYIVPVLGFLLFMFHQSPEAMACKGAGNLVLLGEFS